MRRVDRERALVHPIALSDREEVESVLVVGDEHDARSQGLAVDDEVLAATPVLQRDDERPQPREGLAPLPSPLTAVDEPRVDPQRDVVQEHLVAHAADIDSPLGSVAEGRERRQRIVGIEADVVREVVARAPRDAGEGQVSLHGDLGNSAQRAVASGHAQHPSIRFPREFGEVVVLLEHVNLHARARVRLGSAPRRSARPSPSRG